LDEEGEELQPTRRQRTSIPTQLKGKQRQEQKKHKKNKKNNRKIHKGRERGERRQLPSN